MKKLLILTQRNQFSATKKFLIFTQNSTNFSNKKNVQTNLKDLKCSTQEINILECKNIFYACTQKITYIWRFL